jgi:6-phosphogluconolactonase
MAFQLHTFPDDATLARQAASLWLGELRTQTKNIPKGRAYCVALSGGRIARNFFSEIAKQGGQERGLFDAVHFFWADERCVPPTDPESNYAIARDLLFEPLKIPDAQVHRLRGEENEALALRDALENIETWGSPEKGGGEPIFDMIFLGLGENGHVASLFPEESGTEMDNPAFYRAVTTTKPPPRRLTLGYGPIINASQVWVLVAGAGKQDALRDSLSPSGKTPLARVIRRRRETEIFSDVQI